MWYQVTLNGNVFSKPNVTFLKISNFFNIYVHGSHREACNYEKKTDYWRGYGQETPWYRTDTTSSMSTRSCCSFYVSHKDCWGLSWCWFKTHSWFCICLFMFFRKVWLPVSVYLGLMYSLRHCLSEVIWICQEECSLWASSCSASALLKPFI